LAETVTCVVEKIICCVAYVEGKKNTRTVWCRSMKEWDETEWESMDWINVTQYWGSWWVLGNMLVNCWDRQNVGNCVILRRIDW